MKSLSPKDSLGMPNDKLWGVTFQGVPVIPCKTIAAHASAVQAGGGQTAVPCPCEEMIAYTDTPTPHPEAKC